MVCLSKKVCVVDHTGLLVLIRSPAGGCESTHPHFLWMLLESKLYILFIYVHV